MRYGSTEIDAPLLAEITDETRFVTSIFLGRGEYAKHEAGSLTEAREVGRQMAAHYKNGRVAMVYAMLSDDRTVFVPDHYEQRKVHMTTTNQQKPHAKRFNAQRAAKSVLGKDATEGKEFTTVKNEDGLWEWIRAGMPEEQPVVAATMTADDMAAAVADLPPTKSTPEEIAARREVRKDRIAAEVAKVADMTPEQVAEASKANKAKVREARKAAKPARAADATPTTRKPTSKRAEVEEAARSGKLPEPIVLLPADKRYQKTVDVLHDLAAKRDVNGLRALEIKTYSSTPKRMARWRDLAVMALSSQV